MNLKYGETSKTLDIDVIYDVKVLKGKEEFIHESEEEVIRNALKNPINSKRLEEIVKKDDSICIIISDVTRLWQRQYVFLEYIVEELNAAGVPDENIHFLCALGSHRSQTLEEHKRILGEKLSLRFKVTDHDCRSEENLVYLGKTSYGTPVKVNKMAVTCSHLILTGGIVFHDMAGYGGGRKSILPGISSYETIMANHSLSLVEEEGGGCNPDVRSGSLINNPFHLDMVEAAELIKPSFLFNVITNSEGRISHAVAGHYIDAHEKGCRVLQRMDGIEIDEKRQMVIASCGGYPKDIDLYQASKTLSNAREAVVEGGSIIMLCKCVEGFGHDEVERIINGYPDNLQREKEVREDYTIAKYTGYLICEIAERHKVIIVSDLPEDSLSNAGITVVSRLEDALSLVLNTENSPEKIWVMPDGGNTLPVLSNVINKQ